MSVPVLEVAGIGKRFGGVQALEEVSLTMLPGEVHALIGENGAGKSTLIKILSGSLSPDSGEVTANGARVSPGDVAASEAAGIRVIHQESTAFPHLSAEDNLFVGREPRRCFGLFLDRPRMHGETRALLARLGERFDPRQPLGELPVAQRQMVAIARAIASGTSPARGRVLIMDEPTASLSAREISQLFRIIGQLRSEGAAVLYVSHRLEEIFELSDRVTVLRDGRVVETRPISQVSKDSLIHSMVGREVVDLTGGPARPDRTGEVVLAVRNLTRGRVFRGVSFSIRAGEIVGLAGLVGAGRSEVATTLFGVERPTGGEITVAGSPLPPGSVPAAVRRGVALVPEDRQHLGLVLPLSVGTNLVLAVLRSLSRGGFRSVRDENELALRLMRDLAVRAPNPSVPAETLSGGNQQKLVLGKWLAASPRVLLLDEPTRGIDVGAKAEVYRLIRRLAASGMATLLISSDLPELLSLSDRMIVMRSGTVAGELSRAEATQEKVLALALPPDTAADMPPASPVQGIP